VVGYLVGCGKHLRAHGLQANPGGEQANAWPAQPLVLPATGSHAS
jgi:hypothetical protein